MSEARTESTPEERFVRRALAVRAFLRDPALPGLVLMAVTAVAGFAAMAIGWVGAARTIYAPLQLPELVSGGIGGLALIGVGAFLLDVQLFRKQAARERRRTDDVLDEVAGLVTLEPRLRRIAERRRR